MAVAEAEAVAVAVAVAVVVAVAVAVRVAVAFPMVQRLALRVYGMASTTPVAAKSKFANTCFLPRTRSRRQEIPCKPW